MRWRWPPWSRSGLNPRATGDIGWQLSFVAVIGIMLLARPLQLRLEPVVGSEGWRRSPAEGIAVTVAATIVTAPLIAFHFERLPVGTLAANLAAMPAVAPAMWLGMISVAVGSSARCSRPVQSGRFPLPRLDRQVAEWFGRPEMGGDRSEPRQCLEPGPDLGGAGSGHRSRPAFLAAGAGAGPARRWLPAAVLVLACLILLVPGLTGSGRRHLDAPPPGGARVEILDVGRETRS